MAPDDARIKDVHAWISKAELDLRAAAVFLHPAEAVHGDLGIYTPGDPTVLLSNRGSSVELQALVPLLRQFRSPLIGILGNLATPVTVGPEANWGQALELRERRRSQISVLPVVDGDGRALGLLRIHDIYLGTR